MIRPAKPTDAPAIARLIVLAMGKLAARFANSPDEQRQLALFEYFVGKTSNQYSFTNILVWDEKNQVCGMIIAYDGARLNELRTPFLQHITTQFGFDGQPEDETQAGEYYIDCLAVNADNQGKGIAKALINAVFVLAAQLHHQTVGLLVSKGNDNAKKLYTRLGFEVKDDKTLLGDFHEHLQRNL